MYNPSTHRWLSPDPTGFAAGDPNLYRYVNNQPTDGVDPCGLAGKYWISPGQEGWNQQNANLARTLDIGGAKITEVRGVHFGTDHPGMPDHYKLSVVVEGGAIREIRISPKGVVITQAQYDALLNPPVKQAGLDKFNNRKNFKRGGTITSSGLAGIGIASIATGGVFYIVESSYGGYMAVGEAGAMAKGTAQTLARALQIASASGELMPGQTYTLCGKVKSIKRGLRRVRPAAARVTLFS